MLLRRLDASDYARVKRWRVYAEEGLARREVAVWLGDGEMAVESTGAGPSCATTSRSHGTRRSWRS